MPRPCSPLPMCRQLSYRPGWKAPRLTQSTLECGLAQPLGWQAEAASRGPLQPGALEAGTPALGRSKCRAADVRVESYYRRRRREQGRDGFTLPDAAFDNLPALESAQRTRRHLLFPRARANFPVGPFPGDPTLQYSTHQTRTRRDLPAPKESETCRQRVSCRNGSRCG